MTTIIGNRTGLTRHISLFGVPVDTGASQRGPVMGPTALRIAGIGETLAKLGCTVDDCGDLAPIEVSGLKSPNPVLTNLEAAAGWARRIIPIAKQKLDAGSLPVWLGGDHSLARGTVPGAAAHARSVGRKLFVLWLDAHPDFNTFETTTSGNIHGVPVAYFCGLPGFDVLLGEPLHATVDPANVCMLGIRSVDDAEHDLLREHGVRVHDMREIDEHGVVRLLKPFLQEVADANGMLHVSFDVDFIDPDIAPGVGTTVPGGATFREAHLVMELLHESGLLTSLDIVELNPFLDNRGCTAQLMVDLVGSLFGRKVMDRLTPTKWP
jgi:arginase